MNVYCAATDCKYNNEQNRCTAKRVNLSWYSVNTVWGGRQEFLKCKAYEKSAEAIEIDRAVREWQTMKR